MAIYFTLGLFFNYVAKPLAWIFLGINMKTYYTKRIDFFISLHFFYVMNYGKVVLNSLGKPPRAISLFILNSEWRLLFNGCEKMKEQKTPKWRYEDDIIQTHRVSLASVLSYAYFWTVFCDSINALIYLRCL